jgi:carbon storage regulator CsrA
VLLDLNLPGMRGLEVLRLLRGDARNRLLPVVVLTSSAEERDAIESYGVGANSYARKPVDFGQLLKAARQLGLYWLVLNRRAHPGGRRRMLVLSRRRGERIRIGEHIEVVVSEVRRGVVRLAISAPPGVPILREEVYQAILHENRRAALAPHDREHAFSRVLGRR